MNRRCVLRVGLSGFVVLMSAFATSSQLQGQGGVTVTPNVVYGNKVGLALTMDVYRPAHANGAAIVWVISGGGVSPWRAEPDRFNSDGSIRSATDEELLGTQRFRYLLNAGFTIFAAHHGSAPAFPIEEHVSRRAV